MQSINRRQMLKILGFGAGVVTLGGLTGCTSALLGQDTTQNQVTALSISKAFTRTGRAEEKLNHRLLEKYVKRVKQLAKAMRKELENQPPYPERFQELVKDIQQVDTRIVDLNSEAGVWVAADQDWIELLTQDPNALTLVIADIDQRTANLLKELGFSAEEQNDWSKSYSKRSEEHTSELQSHSFISYAVFCLKKKNKN